jgi:hypothetical protein
MEGTLDPLIELSEPAKARIKTREAQAKHELTKCGTRVNPILQTPKGNGATIPASSRTI